MAEDYHKYWRRQADERQQEKARVAQGFKDTAAAEVPSGWGGDSVAANTPSAPSRSFGFRSGAATPAPGGVATQHAAGAVEAGKSLGEPTSFRGGAGAPAPVAIMRGTRTTFQNPAADQGEGGGYVQTPGSSPTEFATPEQAGQAWNRGMRNEAVAEGNRRRFTTPEATLDTQFGAWRPAGQTVAEMPAKEAPAQSEERKAQALLRESAAAKMQREEADVATKKIGSEFDTLMHESPYSTFEPSTGLAKFKAKDESQYRDFLAARNYALEQGSAKAGREHFEDRQLARKWLMTQPLPADFNADAYLSAVSRNPEAWSELANKARTAGTKPGPVTGGSTVWKELGQIGEHLTPEWMKPNPNQQY